MSYFFPLRIGTVILRLPPLAPFLLNAPEKRDKVEGDNYDLAR